MAQRFVEHRLDGLSDEARPGRPATITAEQVEDVVVVTLESTPANATHWTRAKMAQRTGLSKSTIDHDDPGGPGSWRIAQRVAPDRVISTVDPESRHAHKTTSRRQDGFKAHVVVEPDSGIVTACALTKASGQGSGDAARRSGAARRRHHRPARHAGRGPGRLGL